jgi:pantoate--beta-alanine ligase
MALRVLRTPAEMADWSEQARRAGERIGLVPTMGFLHRGHLSLMAAAAACSTRTVVSIFVNPTQFGPNEDLARYPRDLEGDLAKCADAGIDIVFTPTATGMYPDGHRTFVEVAGLSEGLCGGRRPGHFRGVATVVTQLLALVRPHLAVFGEKDWQQLQIIRRLAIDLHLGVEVVGMPVVREADGLALSSRNAYLSPEGRARALALSRGLQAARAMWAGGERAATALVGSVRAELRAADVREDYVELVDPTTLVPLERADRPDARLVMAAFVGTTRLIDNAPVG